MMFTSSSAFFTPTMIVLLAVIIDALVGDPKWLYRLFPHPVVLLGRLIEIGEAGQNRPDYSNGSRFLRGALVSALVILVAGAAGFLIATLLNSHPLGLVFLAVLASTLIAWRGLWDHVRDVARGLDESLAAGRAAVAHIVGRDPESLDEPAISRAAIESLAENFSDGTVAPVFWFTFLGLPGLCAYKAANTLDSMIGHRSERYEYFGKAAAIFDDIVNYVPARFTGLLIAAAATLSPSANGMGALRAMMQNAGSHRSVNAGFPEAALAGALDIALAGPRIYDGEEVIDRWMNAGGRRDIGPQEIYQALRLYRIAGGLLLLILLLFSGGVYAVT